MGRKSLAVLAAEAEAAASAALAACKDYMRVDGDQDDALIAGLMAAAKEYLDNAGIPEPETASPLYTMAVHSLTLHYYDHRDAVGGEAPLPTGLRPIINQLKHSGEAPL
jgi:uncharacterized phage protein (predicted DNA packaging)